MKSFDDMDSFDEAAREPGEQSEGYLKPSSENEGSQKSNPKIPIKDPYDEYLEDQMMNEGCPNG